MEQLLEGGSGVRVCHPGYPNAITRKEDLPTEEELALVRPDPVDDCTPEGFVAWCEVHVRKLTTLLGQYPDLGRRKSGDGNPSGGFVRVARENGLRVIPEAAVAAGGLFRDAHRWPGDDPFEAIAKLDKLAEWGRQLVGQKATEAEPRPVEPAPVGPSPLRSPPIATAGAPEPESGRGSNRTPVSPSDFPVSTTVAFLAKKTCLKKETLDTALRRFADDHPDCRTEQENPRPNEPKYLYRVTDVWHVVLKLMAKNA